MVENNYLPNDLERGLKHSCVSQHRFLARGIGLSARSTAVTQHCPTMAQVKWLIYSGDGS